MGLMDKYNKGGVTFDIDIKDFTFVDLKSLSEKFSDGEVFKIDGLYINKKSEYGDAPVAILTDCFANLPQHLLGECQDMLKSSEDIEDIKAGKVGFKIEQYEKELKKGSKTCYGIRWVDI